MNDALGKPLSLGDSIVFYRSNKMNLAIITEELTGNSVNTIRCEFYVKPAYILTNRPNAPAQEVIPKITRFRIAASHVVLVDHNSYITTPPSFKPHWATLTTPNNLRLPMVTEQHRRIFEFLRANITVKKLKLPDDLKIL